MTNNLNKHFNSIGNNAVKNEETSIGIIEELTIQNNKAIIEGNTLFKACKLMSSDLRASIALVLAAMTAEGVSQVDRIYHLDRGAENFENKLP